MGSGNRHLTEIMLREIAHIPGPEPEFAEDWELYICSHCRAGPGHNHTGGWRRPTRFRLVERLSVLISGGPMNKVKCGI